MSSAMRPTPSKADEILARFPGPVTLRMPITETIHFLAISIMFTASGYWMVINNAPKGWFVFIFFGFCVIVLLLGSNRRLTLNKDGFEEKVFWRSNRALWENVKEFKAVSFPPAKNRLVGYYDSQWARWKIAKFNERAYGIDATLSNNYGLSANELSTLMTLWQDKAMRGKELSERDSFAASAEAKQ